MRFLISNKIMARVQHVHAPAHKHQQTNARVYYFIASKNLHRKRNPNREPWPCDKQLHILSFSPAHGIAVLVRYVCVCVCVGVVWVFVAGQRVREQKLATCVNTLGCYMRNGCSLHRRQCRKQTNLSNAPALRACFCVCVDVCVAVLSGLCVARACACVWLCENSHLKIRACTQNRTHSSRPRQQQNHHKHSMGRATPAAAASAVATTTRRLR